MKKLSFRDDDKKNHPKEMMKKKLSQKDNDKKNCSKGIMKKNRLKRMIIKKIIL